MLYDRMGAVIYYVPNPPAKSFPFTIACYLKLLQLERLRIIFQCRLYRVRARAHSDLSTKYKLLSKPQASTSAFMHTYMSS